MGPFPRPIDAVAIVEHPTCSEFLSLDDNAIARACFTLRLCASGKFAKKEACGVLPETPVAAAGARFGTLHDLGD
jgi:hypothetical protein